MTQLATKKSAPKRIRIAVGSLKGCCPRPLDDGGTLAKYIKDLDGIQISQIPKPRNCATMLMARKNNPSITAADN